MVNLALQKKINVLKLKNKIPEINNVLDEHDNKLNTVKERISEQETNLDENIKAKVQKEKKMKIIKEICGIQLIILK